MVVEFQPSTYTVNEDNGMVTLVLVKRTPTTQDVTVLISTVDGTATSGVTLYVFHHVCLECFSAYSN